MRNLRSRKRQKYTGNSGKKIILKKKKYKESRNEIIDRNDNRLTGTNKNQKLIEIERKGLRFLRKENLE